MKFKYYLRGLGIGILITTIILSISYAVSKPQISDEDVVKRASELGMVMQETEQELTGKETERNTEQSSTAKTADTQNDGMQGEDNQPVDTEQPDSSDAESGNEQIVQQEFTVEIGDSSNAVAQKLQSLGLVDDAKAFNQYMVDNQYDNFVLPGTIIIRQGATYEEIAQMLVDKTLTR